MMTVSAQILPQNDDPVPSEPSPSPSPTKNPYGIRITDPSKGEEIFINGTDYFDTAGKKLSITGFSVADSGNLTNCDVSIITNSVFPYQSANATGPLGSNDFTKWNYNFNSDYAHLQEGSNKITSKLTCEGGTAKAYYSVNVTGVKFNGTFPQIPTSLDTVTEKNNILNPSQISDNLQSSLDSTDSSTGQADIMNISALSIEILSPSDGEIVNIESPITVNGTSDYPQNYDCEVLLADGNSSGVIAPTISNNSNFKKTTAEGVNGTSDYRNWSIVLEPSSTNLKNGSQSLTAKLQCYSPFSAVKVSEVNIDVIPPKPVELKTMDVSLDKVGQGLNQRIVIGANDVTTNEPLPGSTITGSVNENGFSGSTDADGKYSTAIPQNVLESGETITVSVTITNE
ncbi:MAG: hypothetical protein M3Y25_06570, partial [Thermoproteota archaeon]|nr:hypothetical protein [Thermoproteota archaeon]